MNRIPEDSTIECPHCGAKVFYDLTRCPECGHSFYPLDEEEAPAREHPPGWITWLRGVLIGWLAAAAVEFIAYRLLRTAYTPSSLPVGGQVFLLIFPVFASFGGGWLAGISAGQPGEQAALWQGLGVVLPNLATVLLLASAWIDITVKNLLSPAILVACAAMVPAAWAGAWIFQRNQENSTPIAPSFEYEYDLYHDLLAWVHFDKDVADRLLENERRRTPRATRLELIENAIRRLERDNK